MITPDVFGSVFENFFRLFLGLDDKVNSNLNQSPDKKYDPKTPLSQYAPKKPPEKRNNLSPLEFLKAQEYKPKHIVTIRENKKEGVEGYDTIEKHLEDSRKSLPGATKSPSNVFRTAKNVVYNAIDNTIGYPIAKYQNYQTVRQLKKGKDKPIVYLMHGIVQNEGSQWRFAKQLKKQGFHVQHLKGNHGKRDVRYSVEKAYEQIDKFQKKARIYETASNRKDYFSGHSSGADTGIHMAADKRTIDYGIKRIQARAPVPYGMKLKTMAQRAVGLVGNIKDDSLKYDNAKRRAMETYRKNPMVPVNVIAGKYDKLVPPNTANYIKQETYRMITHKDSGHFGTSGVNKNINKIFAEELDQYRQKDQTVGDVYYQK